MILTPQQFVPSFVRAPEVEPYFASEFRRFTNQRNRHNPVIRGPHRLWDYDLNAALPANRSAALWR
jgi:hypothetical protein